MDKLPSDAKTAAAGSLSVGFPITDFRNSLATRIWSICDWQLGVANAAT